MQSPGEIINPQLLGRQGIQRLSVCPGLTKVTSEAYLNGVLGSGKN